MPKRLTSHEKWQREKAIKGMVLEGVGRTQIYNRLQAIGLGGRKTDVLKKARGFAKLPEKKKSIATVGNLNRIGRASYSETSEYFSDNFRYRMKYTIYNRETGEEQTWYTSIINPTEMRPGQIKAEAMKALAKWGTFYRFSIRKASIDEAEHDPKHAWD